MTSILAMTRKGGAKTGNCWSRYTFGNQSFWDFSFYLLTSFAFLFASLTYIDGLDVKPSLIGDLCDFCSLRSRLGLLGWLPLFQKGGPWRTGGGRSLRFLSRFTALHEVIDCSWWSLTFLSTNQLTTSKPLLLYRFLTFGRRSRKW